jgi:hypothetical protein
MINPPPLLMLAGAIVGSIIGHYLAPVGAGWLIEIVGFVVGVFAAVVIYAYFRPPGS